MKKILLLSMLLCLQIITAKAQYVTIPDANFVARLTQLYPTCMNGNQMDTTCPQIVNASILNVSMPFNDITDLTGIEYFVNLTSLDCQSNQLTSLPPLPNSLTKLVCNSNLLTSLPALPSNLKYLSCRSNGLTTLPVLPGSLDSINCEYNPITILPILPNNIKSLNFNYNSLTSLPTLPDSLQRLFCEYNQLTGLPVLPDALRKLSCFNNQLSSLPLLPGNLKYLRCEQNLLTSLPTLPSLLEFLMCSNNQLTNLPSLPASLKNLTCSANPIGSLPSLPNSLKSLYCSSNQLTNLPSLPNSLIMLDCSFNTLASLPNLNYPLQNLNCKSNQITNIPNLPNSLLSLDCSTNFLTSLPTLPDSIFMSLACANNQIANLLPLPIYLNYLDCGNNLLSSLPILPSSLVTLKVANNQLTSLPSLPSTLIDLFCENNLLTSLPTIPGFMHYFHIQNNNITCIPNLPQESLMSNYIDADISGNPFTCVPNQTNYSFGYPLCVENDLINNPNNCVGANIIGVVFTDQDSDCLYSNSDLLNDNIPVKLFDNQNNLLAQSFTTNGAYSFSTLLPDTFQVRVEDNTLPIAMTCGQPNTQSVNLIASSETITGVNFSVECDTANDISVNLINTQGIVFPGQIHTLTTYIATNTNWYNINCNSPSYSGTVTINVSGPVSFVSATSGALIPAVNGNNFTYSITDFNSLTPQSFGLKLLVDTSAQAEDQICVHVEIDPTPLDADPLNNTYDFCYNVVNSLDPNMKEVYPVNVLPGYDDWFTYTIHFQNTGNAPAFNIRLRDTLDANLDVNTFEIRGYSHAANTSISGNILTVRFNNIMLPDSTTDYEGSMGYFQYRIRPLPNLTNGTLIENTAYIYFDYNAPVVTNTTQNNFDITVGKLETIATKNEFVLFPNPSNGIFNFKDNKYIRQVEVYNLLGEQILAQGNQKQINLSGFAKGIYYARINGEVVVKLVKE